MPTILVADDNSNIQKMVSLVFEEKGIHVVAVGNGEAACRKIPGLRPDIVLADVFMPVRNGYEVCEFVKRDPQFAEIPVILLVGAFDPLDEKEARRVGADGVLKKPFVPPDPLIAMVASLLGKAEPPAIEAPIATIPMPVATPAPRAPARAAHVEPETVPPEFAFGTSARDFDETENAIPAFGEPVATPLPTHQDDEEDYAEPQNEWNRRRSTIDYEISATQSANMVDQLDAKTTAPEPPSFENAGRDTFVHVPFGGVNLPDDSEPSAHPSPIEWMDLMEVPETKPAEPMEESREAAVPAEDHGIKAMNEADVTEAPQYDEAPAESVSVEEPEPPAAPAEVIRFQMPIDSTSPSPYARAGEESSVETVAPDAHESLAITDHAAYETAQEPSQTVVEEPHEAAIEHPFTEPVAEQVADQNPSKPAELDSAAIDSVVAKLLEKLEPQIHAALANGVLRPLVEEMLNREREKK